mmetsp:Transcript_7145/g.11366  ORF Transcript_7145/g.11366 Transcript_7145/m.11366 type:complete len:268 (-) Transcript_7145:1493-2296(-)
MDDDAGDAHDSTGEDSQNNKFANQPGLNQGRWTREEHGAFLKGLEKHGKEWKRIADMIKTRSVVQIRTHAQKYFQKVAKSTGGPVMSTSKKDDIVRPPARKQRKSDDDEDDDGALSTAKGSPSPTNSHGRSGNGPAPKTRGSHTAPVGGVPSNYRKPNSIHVPSFHKPAAGKAVASLRIDSRKNEEGGGITPRTVAAATILLRPRIQHKLQTGGDTPKTREQASWLASHQDHAAQVLGKRRRNTPSSSGAASSSLSWEKAATTASHR